MNTNILCLVQKYKTYRSFSSENIQFLEVKFSIYLNRHVFVMPRKNKNKSCTMMKYADIIWD